MVWDCRGITFGHVHTPADKKLDNGVHYLNSGDWVESLTAIVEKEPGEFELINYTEFMERGETSECLKENEKDFIENEEPKSLPIRVVAA